MGCRSIQNSTKHSLKNLVGAPWIRIEASAPERLDIEQPTSNLALCRIFHNSATVRIRGPSGLKHRAGERLGACFPVEALQAAWRDWRKNLTLSSPYLSIL